MFSLSWISYRESFTDSFQIASLFRAHSDGIRWDEVPERRERSGSGRLELPAASFVQDGSQVYAADVQRAINEAAAQRKALRFVPMVYAVDEKGWNLPSGTRLELDGATFRLSESCQADGAVFSGRDVVNVSITGGRIEGRNDRWQDGVNIRGVHISGSSRPNPDQKSAACRPEQQWNRSLRLSRTVHPGRDHRECYGD